jgi:hypothetical protein
MNIMNNYAESKKTLDKIRSEYDCKGELLFRQAIQYVVDYGASNLQDDWNYEHIKQDINERHDNAEAEGKNLWITRSFELALLECARAIAQVDIYDLLVYIQKEVWLSHEGGIDYDRAVTLLKACMSNIEMWNDCQCGLTLGEFEDIGFDDNEITELGFGYVLDVREDEDDD